MINGEHTSDFEIAVMSLLEVPYLIEVPQKGL